MNDHELYSTVVVRQATTPIRLGDELLGGKICAASVGNLVEANIALEAECERLRKLAQQGEAVEVEVVAWQDADNPLYTTGERRQMHRWATDGYPIVELCRLSDAKRAIADLREELDAAGEILAQQGRRNTELRAERAALSAQQSAPERVSVQRRRPAIAMVLQALDRDAAEGKAARGEMAAELRAAMEAQSAPAGIAQLEAECERLREKLAETKEQSETRWAGYVRESNLRREIEAERDALAAELAAIKGQEPDCDRSACGDFSPGRCDNPDCSARRDRKPALPAAPEGGEL